MKSRTGSHIIFSFPRYCLIDQECNYTSLVDLGTGIGIVYQTLQCLSCYLPYV